MSTQQESRYLQSISNPEPELTESPGTEQLDVTDILESPTICRKNKGKAGSGFQVTRAGIGGGLWAKGKEFLRQNWMWVLFASAFYLVNKDTFQAGQKGAGNEQ